MANIAPSWAFVEKYRDWYAEFISRAEGSLASAFKSQQKANYKISVYLLRNSKHNHPDPESATLRSAVLDTKSKLFNDSVLFDVVHTLVSPADLVAFEKAMQTCRVRHSGHLPCPGYDLMLHPSRPNVYGYHLLP